MGVVLYLWWFEANEFPTIVFEIATCMQLAVSERNQRDESSIAYPHGRPLACIF